MKSKRTDWLLRIVYFNGDNRRVVNFEALYDMSYEAVLETAKTIAANRCVVRLYEFKDSVCFGGDRMDK